MRRELTGFRCDVDTDDQIAELGKIQVHGIAEHLSPWWNRYGRLAIEHQRSIGTRKDRGLRTSHSHVRGANLKRHVAVGIGKRDPSSTAAQTSADNHSDSLI